MELNAKMQNYQLKAEANDFELTPQYNLKEKQFLFNSVN